jgi:predicted DNA binding CopG/RHH family protein
MSRNQKLKKSELDAYEQSIEDALDFKKLKRPSAANQKKVRFAAKANLRELKSARANIRMREDDLEAICTMAEQAGMPYQTLINHIIHLYVTGQLINSQELKKMVDAGVFDKRKASNS